MLDPGFGFQYPEIPLKNSWAETKPRRPRHLSVARTLDPVLEKRDTNVIRRVYPWVCRIVDHYFRLEVEGADNLMDSKSMVVSTHNGGIFTPDAYCLAAAYWRRFGLETPVYGLMHQQGFKMPLMRSLLPKLGAIPASRDNAGKVLDAGFPLLVYPGGDLDVLKPFWKRHRIVFSRRTGFIATAIRHQAPIVPVVSVGAHETLFVINDGRWLARAIGLRRVARVKTAPLAIGFPFGLTVAGLFNVPLPSKIVLRVLPRIELCEPVEKAEDPDTLARCYAHVTETMQAALTDLASARRFPVIG